MGRYSESEIGKSQEIHALKLTNQNPFEFQVITMLGQYKFSKEDVRRYYIINKKSYDIILG